MDTLQEYQITKPPKFTFRCPSCHRQMPERKGYAAKRNWADADETLYCSDCIKAFNLILMPGVVDQKIPALK